MYSVLSLVKPTFSGYLGFSTLFPDGPWYFYDVSTWHGTRVAKSIAFLYGHPFTNNEQKTYGLISGWSDENLEQGVIINFQLYKLLFNKKIENDS